MKKLTNVKIVLNGNKQAFHFQSHLKVHSCYMLKPKHLSLKDFHTLRLEDDQMIILGEKPYKYFRTFCEEY